MKASLAILILILTSTVRADPLVGLTPHDFVPDDVFHREAIPVPVEVQVSAPENSTKLQIRLSNGFDVQLDLANYSQEDLRYFNQLSGEDRAKFLKYRKAWLKSAALTLRMTKLVSGSVLLMKDTLYFVGRKASMAKNYYEQNLGNPSYKNSLSIFREVPPISQVDTFQTPAGTYASRLNAFYSKALQAIDSQMVRYAGIKNDIMAAREFGVQLGVNLNARVQSGTAGAGASGTFYITMGYNHNARSFFMTTYGDREAAKAGVGFPGLNIRAGVFADSGDAVTNEAVNRGDITAPPGPATITRVGRRISFDVASSISGVVGAFTALNFGLGTPAVLAALFGGNIMDMAMTSVGEISRLEIGRISIGRKTEVAKGSGWPVVKESSVVVARSIAARLSDPRALVNQFVPTSGPYRSASRCSIIFEKHVQ